MVKEETSQINEPTGNELKQIDLEFKIIGKTKRKELRGILKDNFVLKIPSKNIEIKAKSKTNSYNYNVSNSDEDTLFKYNIEIEELDKDLPEDWDYRVGYGNEIINNYARSIALIDLLMEKGIKRLRMA